jgi:hypothetical protein
MAFIIPPMEVGSLKTLSPDGTQFIGSSSGVFFVDTVHRAFAISKSDSYNDISTSESCQSSSIDNCIVGEESNDSSQDIDGSRSTAIRSSPYLGLDPRCLGLPPSRAIAKELIMIYFRAWHPLFPFIHGPTFLRGVEELYTSNELLSYDKGDQQQDICRSVTFQCIFNIAALDRTDINLDPDSTISSSTALVSILSSLTSKHDVGCLQALLAGQLYLIATMSLHAASTVGGMLVRLIFHAGFHRCPARYGQLTKHDCDMRKRVFWCAYIADRYLSQALGLPLGIQDSDIDVCIPGTDELHRPASRSDVSTATQARASISSHMPQDRTDLDQSQLEENPWARGSSLDPNSRRLNSDASNSPIPLRPQTRRHTEEALANYVAYGKLTGRILEMFHKSIHMRKVEYSDYLELTGDIHSFWNDLPQRLQDLPSNNESGQDSDGLSLFFNIIYQQLILLINRPFLSLEPTTPEFRCSLQACIGASRTIIKTLQGHKNQRHITWPGILSGTWMSGLILAFASALNLYPPTKAFL